MQIKFLTSICAQGNYEVNKALGQAELLTIWSKCIQSCQIKFINKATIEFIDYDFSDYPDQEKTNKAISEYFGYSYKLLDEDTYEDFLTKFRILELVITIEDYD